MNRVEKIAIVVLLFLMGVWLLYPTFKWNVLVSESDKNIANSTNTYIADYCRDKAREETEDLEEQASLEAKYRQKYKKLKKLSSKSIKLGLDLRGGLSVLLEADVDSTEKRRGSLSAEDIELGLKDDIEILRRRVDSSGVSEVDIHTQAGNQIVIELPGTKDPEAVNQLLRGSGSLKFAIVDADKTNQFYMDLADDAKKSKFISKDGALINDVYEEGFSIHGFYEEDDLGMEIFRQYFVINDNFTMDASYINSVEVAKDNMSGRPLVNFHMSTEGGDKFYDITSKNVKRSLSVMLDGKIKSVATIQQALSTDVSVSGFSQEDAQELALILKSSSLPVDLKVVSSQLIGASLGEDTVSQLIKAIMIGFVILAAFMVLYYGLSGILSVFMLILDMFLLVSILASLSLTLTLTSIAGIILTLGMAADSSIIIFERIKEDLSKGLTPYNSVASGYKRARLTILDANITTMIAALVLSMIGTTTVKGFANTLAIGIVCTLITMLFSSHTIIDLFVGANSKFISIGYYKRNKK